MNYKLLGGLMKILPNVKGWIWSDGKFNVKRSIILLIFLVVLGLGYHFLGEEGVNFLLHNLDEISDIIGYEE